MKFLDETICACLLLVNFHNYNDPGHASREGGTSPEGRGSVPALKVGKVGECT
jgi:hypothetical protein